MERGFRGSCRTCISTCISLVQVCRIGPMVTIQSWPARKYSDHLPSCGWPIPRSCLIISLGERVLNGDRIKLEVHVAETLKKGTRVTGVDRSKLATTLGKRYDSGESIRSLAASTGRSYGFVNRSLSETGVTLRGRGGATRSGKNKVKH